MKKRIIKNGFVSDEAALKVNNYKDSSARDDVKKNESQLENPSTKISEKEEAIINNAKKEAEKIINDGKKEADRIYEEQKKIGYEKGYEEGKKNGFEEISKEKDAILNEVINIKEDAQKRYRDILRSSEKDIVDIIFNISNKLIYDKLNKDKNVVINIVKETIEKTTHRNSITLYVSSADFNTVTNKRGRLLAKIDGIETLEIFHDDTLPIGSCRVETSCGIIESNLENRIEGLKSAFYELLKSEDRG